ncbi:MAG: dTMP kinase [Candidatus Omnitrophota bacterium]|jgi:dTMP kinase
MAKKLKKGIFITFEGPEGSGKSTHAKNVYKELVKLGYDVEYTFEPGATALGEKIRGILLGPVPINIAQKAELFLFEADRAQHVKKVILPALKAKKVVLCDRFNAATFAYQGYGLGMDMEKVEEVDALATEGLAPDLTILLDIDVETGLSRATAGRRADKMEKRSKQFHEKVRRGYLAIAAKHADKMRIVKVEEEKDKTYKSVWKEVYGLIERYTRAE